MLPQSSLLPRWLAVPQSYWMRPTNRRGAMSWRWSRSSDRSPSLTQPSSQLRKKSWRYVCACAGCPVWDCDQQRCVSNLWDDAGVLQGNEIIQKLQGEIRSVKSKVGEGILCTFVYFVCPSLTPYSLSPLFLPPSFLPSPPPLPPFPLTLPFFLPLLPPLPLTLPSFLPLLFLSCLSSLSPFSLPFLFDPPLLPPFPPLLPPLLPPFPPLLPPSLLPSVAKAKEHGHHATREVAGRKGRGRGETETRDTYPQRGTHTETRRSKWIETHSLATQNNGHSCSQSHKMT